MNLFSNIADLFLGSRSRALVVPEDFEPPKALGQTLITAFTRGSDAWNEFFGPAGLGGLPVPSRQAAMTSTAVHACVNIIASAIMAMPVNIYRVNVADGERERLYTDDLVWILNEEMSPRWSASAGWEFLICSLLFEGDGFAIIKRKPLGQVIGLEPVHPLRVEVAVYEDGSRLVYIVEPEFVNGRAVGTRRIINQDDMLHIPGFGFDGLRGVSPLRHSLRTAGALALAQQDYSARFFANSARPDYALTTDQQLQPPKVKELQDLIDERHRTPENAHRPMLLHSGLKMSSLSVSASDMQLLERQKFSVEEICRAYGVPPFMVGHTEKTTSFGSGVESMGKGFVRYSLRQHIHKCEVEINRKLFRTASRVAEFDTSDLERADTKALMESLRVGVGRAGEPRMMTPNEARKVLRLKRGNDPADDALGINGGKPDPAAESSGQSQQQETAT